MEHDQSKGDSSEDLHKSNHAKNTTKIEGENYLFIYFYH